MTNFDKGVEFYSQGTITVTINFPEGDKRCKWCPFCRSDQGLGRCWCRLTNDILFSVETLGAGCPLEFKGEEDGEDGKFKPL